MSRGTVTRCTLAELRRSCVLFQVGAHMYRSVLGLFESELLIYLEHVGTSERQGMRAIPVTLRTEAVWISPRILFRKLLTSSFGIAHDGLLKGLSYSRFTYNLKERTAYDLPDQQPRVDGKTQQRHSLAIPRLPLLALRTKSRHRNQQETPRVKRYC